MNILFLDKEGGFGGSSRSLYYLIKYLDREHYTPLVVSKEDGPIKEMYEKLGVDHRLLDLTVFKPSKRKNLVTLALFLLRIASFFKSARNLSRLIRENKIDLIHLNHDAFFIYLLPNRLFWKKKIVSHMRTMLPVNFFSRLQAKIMKAFSDLLIFISSNEKERFIKLAGPSTENKYLVISNIAEKYCGTDKRRHEWLNRFDNKFKVLWMGNISLTKGSDRIIDIARELRKMGRSDITFLVCGIERHKTSRPNQSREAMNKSIRGEGLESLVYMAGFQEHANAILAASQVLIRVSRDNDPWGRDIIEALVNGKPVVATGKKSPYMEDGVHGYLFGEFNPVAFAKKIAYLADNRNVYEQMAANNLLKSSQLFSGDRSAHAVSAGYDQVMASGKTTVANTERKYV